MKKLSLFILSIIPVVAMAQTVPTLVADIAAGTIGSSPKSITALGSEIIFQATNGAVATNLFRYKPSTGVTQITGAGGTFSTISHTNGYYGSFGVNSGKAYFVGHNPPPDSTGTSYSIAEAALPVEVANSSVATFYSYISDMQTALIGTKLYCWGSTPSGNGLCYVDATNNIVLAGVYDPFEFGPVTEMTACNGKVFYTGTQVMSTTLRMFDPATSTFTIVPISGVSADQAVRNLWGGDNNVLYFSAKTTSEGRELFSYSATGVVTKLTSLNTSADGVWDGFGGNARNLIKFGNAIYFCGCNGLNGFELMKYDITTATATLVKDINPSAASSYVRNFYIFGGKLYFSANNGTNGYELWVTDGTAANTTMVADINPGSADSNPAYFCAMGGKMYFAAENAISGIELFSYSGGSVDVPSLAVANNSSIVFPNPAHNTATIGLTLADAASVSVVMTDIAGKFVYKSEQKNYAAGNVSIVIPMQSYSPGIYQYNVVKADGSILAVGKIAHE